MRAGILSIFLAVSLLLPLSACGNTAQNGDNGGVLRYGVTTEIDSFDPHLVSGGDTKGLLFNIFEGLLKPAPDGSLQEAVAESYSMERNGEIFNFILRDNVFFHNGAALTPEDAVYSLKRAMENKVTGFEAIENIEADGKKIIITLLEPDTEFIYALAQVSAAIVPCNYDEQASFPIGTGPFKFESYAPQQSLVMKKNDEYYGTLASLEEITVVFEADTNVLTLSLRSGNIDAAGLAFTAAEQLDRDMFNIIERYSHSVQMLALNNDYEPFKDIRVRQALCYAVDKDEIIQKAFFGYGTKVGAPVIPGIAEYFNGDIINAYPHNAVKAKELLSEAGYENGFELEITVPSNYTVHVDTAQVIVNQLAEAGIKASIKLADWPAWLDNVYSKREYQATVISIGAASLSPRDELIRYVSVTGNNFFNYKSPAYDKAFNDTLTVGADLKATSWKGLQKLLSDEAPCVFIQDISGFTALNKKFEGLMDSPVYGVIDFSTIYEVS